MKYQLDQVHLLGRVVISKTAPSYMALYLKPISTGEVLLGFHTPCDLNGPLADTYYITPHSAAYLERSGKFVRQACCYAQLC